MTEIEKNHVKKGDQVKVMSGEQKGFLGIISFVNKKTSRVSLEGILPRIKYVKNRQQGGEAQKIDLPILIHVSNVMLWDKLNNKPSRIGYKIQDGKKVRYFKKSGNVLQDSKSLSK
jgi:large subunit ribosomal protein L24